APTAAATLRTSPLASRHALGGTQRGGRARDRECTVVMPGRRDTTPPGRAPAAAPPAPGLGPEDTRSRSRRKGRAPAVTRREVGRRPIDVGPWHRSCKPDWA